MADICSLIAKGYIDEVERLLKKDRKLANAKDHDGRSALHVAAQLEKDDMARLLLKSGAKPNAKDPNGRTPLIEASATGSLGVVKLLLKHGATLETKDTQDGRTALQWAAYHLEPKVTRALIRAGANARAKDKKGFNLLHLVLASPEFNHADANRVTGVLGQLVEALGEGAVEGLLAAKTKYSNNLTGEHLLDKAGIEYVRPHIRDGYPVRGYFRSRK